MAAMMPSGQASSNPYEHYDSSAIEQDLIDPDDAGLDDLDDPLQSTSDRAPLTGNIQSQSSSNNRDAQSYLTSSIPGEDRRAPVNTIDETVWETLSRDLLAVWEKMRQVLWPKYLLGGILQRGGGIGGAERGEGDSLAGGARGIAGRWPDADVVLQAGMSEGLRDWDLWGPLLFCLLLSFLLSRGAQDDQRSLVFSGVFAMVWIGEAVMTLQIKLLGGNMWVYSDRQNIWHSIDVRTSSFFQAVCIIGYTLFPLVIAALLSALHLPVLARIPVYLVLVAWSLAAGVSILGGSGVVKNRVEPSAPIEIELELELELKLELGVYAMTRASAQRQLTPQPSKRSAPSDTVLSPKSSSSNMPLPPVQDADVLSDVESGERPVREKLKKTSIATLPDNIRPQSREDVDMPYANGVGIAGEVFSEEAINQRSVNTERGRLSRKRSLEDLEAGNAELESAAKPGKHVRKRSRDVDPGEKEYELGRRKTSVESAVHEEDETPSIDAEAIMETDKTLMTSSNDALTSVLTSENIDEESRERVVSPKNKRSRDQFQNDQKEVSRPTTERNGEGGTSSDGNNEEENSGSIPDTPVEPKTKRHRDSASPRQSDGEEEEKKSQTEIPVSRGFADTSDVSSFAALAGSKPPFAQPQTSPSAFASSGFGALASSKTSGFGALGNTVGSTSPFGAISGAGKPAGSSFASSSTTTIEPAKSGGFGGLSTASTMPTFGNVGGSGFGPGASGFSKIGGGFGGGFGSVSGGNLSSFASKTGSGILGLSDKPARAFGAAPEEDDEEGSGADEDDGEIKSPRGEEEKKDRRFFEQKVDTGEEDETTEFTCRAKLYNFVKTSGEKKEWKERGLGNLKLNVTYPVNGDNEERSKLKARFVLRAEGSQRVALNSPILKELKIGNPQGGPPVGGYVYFMGSVDDKPQLELLQLKMKQQFAVELCEKIADLQKIM
ncbi:hypothetical protein B0A49_00579 [Cryomyces minteri]|uniref:RanBD1 domain-containing protein n=2 Tax=Cryomyces TaxID=329878 RepID=A0A4U0Y2K7_9PEZI|nr:hypothetical protein B0A49_00579 [Cryomyces minteri]